MHVFVVGLHHGSSDPAYLEAVVAPANHVLIQLYCTSAMTLPRVVADEAASVYYRDASSAAKAFLSSMDVLQEVAVKPTTADVDAMVVAGAHVGDEDVGVLAGLDVLRPRQRAWRCCSGMVWDTVVVALAATLRNTGRRRPCV